METNRQNKDWPITGGQLKALRAYLKLKKVSRASITQDFGGRLTIEVPAKYEGIAGYCAIFVFSRVPGVSITIKKLPWWKFWVWGV